MIVLVMLKIVMEIVVDNVKSTTVMFVEDQVDQMVTVIVSEIN